MKTLKNYYLENLSLFSQELRKNGVPSGINETKDAARIIEDIGLADRNTVRYALCSIFAKSKREQSIFFKTFDDFFVGENVWQKRLEKTLEEEAKEYEEYENAMDELKYEGKPLNLKQEIKDAYANLPPKEREQIMQYLNISTSNMRSSPYKEKFFMKTIEQRVQFFDTQDGSSQMMPEEVSDLLFKNISDISDDEIPQVISLIQSMVKKINGAVSREYHKTGRGERLDYRATIHESLKTGGSFYKLKYKKRRRSRKQIILLCDVSGSMIKFSQFAIRFIKSLSDVSKGSETYLFSEDFQKVSPFVLNNMKTFESYVKQCGLWGKGTDIGNAIDELMKSSSHLNSSTVLLILSDTKTISINNARESLRKISRRVSQTIWMNPVPQVKWNNMNSVTAFRSYCQMVDCSTLNNLAKACTRLI
jgi:uncharacterized protein with von Willebrand factor type A (vWA) domain